MYKTEISASSKGAGSADPALLLSAEQVAALLNIHRATVFNLMRQGDLRSLRIGRRRLVTRAAIDDFITRRETADQS
jgi:excisionase family DNA binding protein